jgi:hypothetical protein
MTAPRFAGKVAVVTGAAGGIGRAVCETLAADGARIVAVDLEREALEPVVGGVVALGSEAQAVAADVTRADDVRRFLAEATSRFGGVDLLVNNAGIEGVVKPFEEYPEDVFDRVLAVNVRGVFLAEVRSRGAARARRRRDRQPVVGRGRHRQRDDARLHREQARGDWSHALGRDVVSGVWHPRQRGAAGADRDADDALARRRLHAGRGRDAEADDEDADPARPLRRAGGGGGGDRVSAE